MNSDGNRDDRAYLVEYQFPKGVGDVALSGWWPGFVKCYRPGVTKL